MTSTYSHSHPSHAPASPSARAAPFSAVSAANGGGGGGGGWPGSTRSLPPSAPPSRISRTPLSTSGTAAASVGLSPPSRSPHSACRHHNIRRARALSGCGVQHKRV
eukprot:1174429-Prorocentrum_minimum.AAC.3